MFFQNRNRDNKRQGNSVMQTLVNVATIVSTAVTCVRLAYNGILSIQVSGLIMFGVVVFVALGNNLSKIILAAVALILFVLLYSQGNKAQFSALLSAMLTLIIVLIGIYIMIRAVFRK